jgi:hypothetical protein
MFVKYCFSENVLPTIHIHPEHHDAIGNHVVSFHDDACPKPRMTHATRRFWSVLSCCDKDPNCVYVCVKVSVYVHVFV